MAREIKDLFEMYYQDIYRYLYSLCHDSFLAEDLAGEVFLEVLKSLGKFREESDVKTWLFSIARHRWMKYLRKQNRYPKVEMLSELLGDTKKIPEEVLLEKEITDRIKKLIDQEPDKSRGIFYMRMEGYSFYEIGRKYGVSESSARVMEFRLKTKVRRTLEKEGYIND